MILRDAAYHLREMGILSETLERLKSAFELFDNDPDDAEEFLHEINVTTTSSFKMLGSANYNLMRIRVTTLKTTESEQRDTFLHELAHLVSSHLFGVKGRGHGPRWEMIAGHLGATPEEFAHSTSFKESVAEKRTARERVVARCLSCGHEFKRSRKTSMDWSKRKHRNCPRGIGTIIGV
jgi:predicted SprT family Zn-dependent metalloprotease